MVRPLRGLTAFGAATIAVLATCGQLSAAIGPTVMMFHGAPLAKPVFLTGADTSAFGDLLRKTTLRVAAMGDRPYFAVALFWGPPSEPARNGVRNLVDLTPQMAWQHGRFYPAHAGQPAVMLVTALAKREGVVPYPVDPSWYQLGGPVPADAGPVLARAGLAPK